MDGTGHELQIADEGERREDGRTSLSAADA